MHELHAQSQAPQKKKERMTLYQTYYSTHSDFSIQTAWASRGLEGTT